jgi:superoxide dismutase, Fe-Mn family
METIKNKRRSFLQLSALAGAGLILSSKWSNAFSQTKEVESLSTLKKVDSPPQNSGPFTLPPLPYGYDALEPAIDTQTMTIHHDKHHAGYVAKLNDAIAKAPELNGKSLEDLLGMIEQLPESVRMTIRNNGGGDWNHTFFWQILSPEKNQQPTGKLADAINAEFKSVDEFKKQFNDSATKVFGSGWTWLIKGTDGKLAIVNTPNQDNPLMSIAEKKGKPILGVDVWEHAYYLKHQNKRADYLNDIWAVINWKKAGENFGG